MSGVSQLISRIVLAFAASFASGGCRIFPWHIATAFVLSLAPCCLPSSVRAQADITVDVTTVTDTVNPFLFGHNVLFSNGIWDTRTNDLHAGAAPLVHSLAPSVLRFPGGSDSDLYFWEDAIGLKTAAAVSAGTSSISLASMPNWGTVSSGRFVDAAEGQFGDTFTFTAISGTQLQGVSGVGVSHLTGAEVRPGQRQGQPAWFSNQYGIDEHMKLAASLGAAVILTVNYGSGRDRNGAVSTTASLSQRVKRAAAWVAYLNGSLTDTRPLGVDAEGTDWQTVGYWAQKRGQRGHPAPYGVHYWEIGNEVFGDWETGFTTARLYATDFSMFATTMKSIDPSIEVGAVGLADPHARGDADSVEEWNATVVRIAGDTLDFLAIHAYYPSANLTQAQGSYTSTTWFTAVMAGAQQAIKDLQEIRAVVIANSVRAAQIELAVTEYGIWPADSITASNCSSLARALYDADLLLQLMQRGAQLGASLATAWNLHGSNQTAAIRYDWSTGNRLTRPQYYAFQLVNDLAPQLHSVTVNAPTFSTTQVGNVDPAPSIPTLAAVASSDDAGRLTFLVLNRSLSGTIPTSIHLLGYSPQATGVIRSLTGDSLAANNDTNSSAVVLTASSMTSAAATFSYTFPARSLTMIELQATSGLTTTPPTAVINAAPLQGKAPLTVTFNGSGNTAGSSLIVAYGWDMGDGSRMSSMAVSHTYPTPGTYTVTLTVTDSAGLTGMTSTTIKVLRKKG
jgi:alpha-N-arabinofuranosidase